MSISLYLDDCSNSDLLADLLRQAGYRVIRPTDPSIGLEGEDDDAHFAFAKANGLTIITKNPADFQNLHDLHPNHAGILAVYQDNNANRDMSDADVVRAIKNLESAAQNGGEPIQGRFHSLNDWQY